MLKDYTKENLQAVFNDENTDTDGLNFQETLEKMESFSPKQWAVFKYFGEDLELVGDISELDIDTDEIEINGETLLVLTDDEADDRWNDELDAYLDEYVYSELPKNFAPYFNEEKWKQDARFDGRGHAISHYDGCEVEYFIRTEDLEETWIYIYRM